MSETGFAHFAGSAPEATGIVESSGRVWTRGQLYGLMNQVARGLRSVGVGCGDTVAIVAPNCIEFIAAYMAATQIGAYVVPVNWHLAHSEVAYVLRNSHAKALFAHERVSHIIHALTGADQSELRARVCFGRIEGFAPLEEFAAGYSDGPLADPALGRMLMYTSATTGRPKAITSPISDAQLHLDKTIEFHRSCGLELGNEVHLCASMLYHSGPLDFAATALHMGHTIVLVERWVPLQLLELIEKYRVTTAFMVPTMFVQLLKLPEERRLRFNVSSLKLVVHTAAPCPVDTKRQMLAWWGPVLRDGYGAAEGVGTCVTAEEWLAYPGTVGRPVPGSRIKIFDDAGNELPAGSIGTIYMTRYQGDRFEYRDDPEKTRAAYRGDFFTAGDMGYLNEQGYLFICDRKIDMIIRGGTNIYPAEIEQVLVQHPQIADCAVFGVPDDIMGEAVHATVQLLPNVVGDRVLKADILAFLRERLSTSKLPRRIEFVAQLPRDPNGKLYKRLLRQPHWQGRASTI